MTVAWFTFLLGAFLATPIGICAGLDLARWIPRGRRRIRIELPRATATWRQRRAWKRDRRRAGFR